MTETIYSQENSEYLEKNENWHIEDSPWKAEKILSIMNENGLHPNSIVEIGCGAGEILVQLQKKTSDKNVMFSGYDIAPDVKHFWPSRINEKIHFFNEDLLEKNEIYDLLLMIDVFEHVDDYFGFIKKASTKAEYKIFHIPLDINAMSILRNTPSVTREIFGHIHFFTKDTALSTLKDCGLEIIDYQYTGSLVELNNVQLSTKLLKLPRKILFAINKDFASRLLGGYSLIVLAK